MASWVIPSALIKMHHVPSAYSCWPSAEIRTNARSTQNSKLVSKYYTGHDINYYPQSYWIYCCQHGTASDWSCSILEAFGKLCRISPRLQRREIVMQKIYSDFDTKTGEKTLYPFHRKTLLCATTGHSNLKEKGGGVWSSSRVERTIGIQYGQKNPRASEQSLSDHPSLISIQKKFAHSSCNASIDAEAFSVKRPSIVFSWKKCPTL